MAVIDLWVNREGERTKRYGRGLRYRVTEPGHPTKSFRTRTEAQDHWIELRDKPARPPAETVDAMLQVWQVGKQHLARKTVLAAKADVARVSARWGRTLVTEVVHDDVQLWISSMTSQRGKGDKVRVWPAATQTRVKALQCLRGALAVAIRLGMITKDPTEGVTTGRLTKTEPRFLDVDELRDLAAAAGRDRALVMLLGTTGLRIGEACALEVGDVDVKRGRLRVRRSKTGVPRDVPIPKSVLALLEVKDRGRREPLFRSPRGSRVNPDNWRARVWTTIAPEGMRIHDLRHTAASLAIASGADVKAVQRMLGHATATMTLDLYGHLLDRGLDDVAVRMDSMLSVAEPVNDPVNEDPGNPHAGVAGKQVG